jgi:hypothetical protein
MSVERLRLLAEDAADLDVMAAAVQDALARIGDFNFDKKTRRFSALINRFRWERADENARRSRSKAC